MRRTWGSPWRGLPAYLAPVALLLGCGDGGPVALDMTVPPSICANQTGADTYAQGLQKKGAQGLFTVTLLASQPGPPAVGVNTWNLQVRDAGGATRADLQIKALPWMPEHNHGTSVKAAVTPVDTDGTYTVTPLYLYMAGLWQVTLQLQTPTLAADQVIFTFCLEQN